MTILFCIALLVVVIIVLLCMMKYKDSGRRASTGGITELSEVRGINNSIYISELNLPFKKTKFLVALLACVYSYRN